MNSRNAAFRLKALELFRQELELQEKKTIDSHEKAVVDLDWIREKVRTGQRITPKEFDEHAQPLWPYITTATKKKK